MPWIDSAPSSSTIVSLPGMPIPSVGTISPDCAAFCAASLAATPSTLPLPNSSGRFETIRACW